ncbi:glycosyltransferase family 2 protein [Thiocapsa roseopersicina]|uniref:Glycosyl transferase family 2 n=1 Tax=Thiocapsa roseopersicina TaxID=1058 RepID=A0A1H2QB25_THIRO|nr:glycosyltransferase family A protein [Thiocapsa roseopersicina]SDW04356.1 Glycosyl transferase family 2 [Thiocapsa roseopersicina]
MATIVGLVSTIIPVFNRPEMLLQSVHSVLNQDHRPIEVIIVDDGSTDETAGTADALQSCYPDLIKVLHIENRGAGLAREAGRRIAQGEFIQYLDSDDLLLQGKFSIQIEALRRHPECGIAYGWTRLIDANGNIIKVPYKWTGQGLDTLFPSLLIDRWWNTHTPLYRRSVCDEVGPWTDMRMSEDWEYEARVGALGVRLVFCPQACSDTRRHSGDRLTSQADPLAHPQDMTRLIKALNVSGAKAGVNPTSREMAHFSRWAFLEARRAGASGFPNESRECYEIALSASAGRLKGQFLLYRTAVGLFGWKGAGRLGLFSERLRNASRRGQGLPLSWTDS